MNTNTAYMVTASGVKEGKPYATLTRIVKGQKQNGDSYEFLDANTTLREQEVMRVGEIVEYKTERAPKKV